MMKIPQANIGKKLSAILFFSAIIIAGKKIVGNNSKLLQRSYWLNVFLTKLKSILTEKVLNQWKKIKNITNCGLQPQYYSDKHQDL